jgi:hypothetical protein
MQPTHRRLRIVAFVYGLLYLLFIALGTIPATRSAIFSRPEHPSFQLEQSLTFLLFALFLVGLIVWSHSELGAGLVFLIWYGQIFWADQFSTRYGMGGGAGPVLGIPVLVIGLILVAAWIVNCLRSRLSAVPPRHD